MNKYVALAVTGGGSSVVCYSPSSSPSVPTIFGLRSSPFRKLIIGVVPGVVENDAVCGCVAGLAYMDTTMAIPVRKHFALGSTRWWREMDYEGRGGFGRR